MRNLFANESFIIEPGQAVSGIARHPLSLRIFSGRVWVTVAGNAQDYWLAAGEMLTVAPGHLIVVEADKLASCVGTQLAASQPGLSGVRAWIGQLAHRFMRNKTARTIARPPVVSMNRCQPSA